MEKTQWFHYQCDDEGTLYDALEYINPEDVKNAPTVDAVEVVYGQWELYPSSMHRRCSVCKMEYDRPKFNVRANYCPNCGAKMDGDGNG